MGAYQPGTNADLDAAIALRPEIEHFLQQDMHDPCGLDETRQALLALYQKSLQLSGANVEAASAKPATPASFRQPAPGMRVQARGGKT